MNRQYWDTSALLKIYVPENDSELFLGLIEKSDQPIFTSAISAVEIRCALNRKEHAGDVRRTDAAKAINRFAKDCAEGRIMQLPCGDDMAIQARELVDLARSKRSPVMIRSLDAVHIASALSAGADTIVTTDVRMREVAALVQLELVPRHYLTK